MPTQRLLISWVIGTSLIGFVLWGQPYLERRSAGGTQVAALRADSAEAFRVADSARRANHDTVTAYVYVPPDPLGFEARRKARESRQRPIVAGLLLAMLAWNTVVWARARRRRVPMAT